MAEEAHHGRWRRVYGLSPEQYLELYDKQGGACGVCRKHSTEFRTRLHVDHNHASGEVRGLLCHYCNLRIIGKHKDPEVFRRAAEYLEQGHTGWFVPPKKKKKRTRRGHPSNP